eukprot:SAG31_NODE_681_length_12844_cov_31.703021_4_plen_298_part_00
MEAKPECWRAGLPNPSPAYDLVSFDDFHHSVLTIFVMLTLEGWTDVMYAIQDGVSPWAWIYFVMVIYLNFFFCHQHIVRFKSFCTLRLQLIAVGVFVVINLFLAVIAAGYEAQVEAEDEERKLDEEAGEYLKMLGRGLREILTAEEQPMALDDGAAENAEGVADALETTADNETSVGDQQLLDPGKIGVGAPEGAGSKLTDVDGHTGVMDGKTMVALVGAQGQATVTSDQREVDAMMLRQSPPAVQFLNLFTKNVQDQITSIGYQGRKIEGEGNRLGYICDDAFKEGLRLLQLGAGM